MTGASLTESTVPRLALSVEETAASLSVSERTIKNWTRDGQIPFVRLGERILYPVDLLREWLADKAKTEKRPAKVYRWKCQECEAVHDRRPKGTKRNRRCGRCGANGTLKRIAMMLDNNQGVPQNGAHETIGPTSAGDIELERIPVCARQSDRN